MTIFVDLYTEANPSGKFIPALRFSMFFLLLQGLVLIHPERSVAQANIKDSSVAMTLVSPGFAIQVPMGDLDERFGSNSSVSMTVSYKFRSKWIIEAQGSFIFGSKVEQPNLFSNLITSQGQIIGTDGKYADIRAFERGYGIFISGGRLLTAGKLNPNSGFFFTAGAGYLQHKIKIEDKLGVTPALQEEYLKGYDHLAGGLCLKQTIGYIYISSYRLVNFYAAFEAMEGFTRGLRSYDFDLEKPDTEKRMDILTGIRVGWILPLYKKAPDKYYLY